MIGLQVLALLVVRMHLIPLNGNNVFTNNHYQYIFNDNKPVSVSDDRTSSNSSTNHDNQQQCLDAFSQFHLTIFRGRHQVKPHKVKRQNHPWGTLQFHLLQQNPLIPSRIPIHLLRKTTQRHLTLILLLQQCHLADQLTFAKPLNDLVFLLLNPTLWHTVSLPSLDCFIRYSPT